MLERQPWERSRRPHEWNVNEGGLFKEIQDQCLQRRGTWRLFVMVKQWKNEAALKLSNFISLNLKYFFNCLSFKGKSLQCHHKSKQIKLFFPPFVNMQLYLNCTHSHKCQKFPICSSVNGTVNLKLIANRPDFVCRGGFWTLEELNPSDIHL